MMKYIQYISIFLFCIQCRSAGLKKAEIPSDAHEVFLGFIENRDTKYGSSNARNIEDRLIFFLNRKGIQVRRNSSSAEKEKILQNGVFRIPLSYGEEKSYQSSYKINDKEIRNILQDSDGALFIQGSFSVVETGSLLDRKELSYFFLEVFDRNGKRVLAFQNSETLDSLDEFRQDAVIESAAEQIKEFLEIREDMKE